MVPAVAQADVAGVSPRRVERLVQAMGIEGISKSPVSEMAKELDQMVETFRSRPPAPTRTSGSTPSCSAAGRAAGW
jgi:putative transposase